MTVTLSNFQQRALFGTLGALFVIVAILYSHTSPFDLFFVAITCITQAFALSEYYSLSREKQFEPNLPLGIFFSTSFLLFHFLGINQPLFGFLAKLTLALFAACSFLYYFKKQEGASANLAITFFGLVYVTLPLSLLFDINWAFHTTSLVQNGFESSFWLVFLIIATKMTDTFAYFFGKNFGSIKIAPKLSPKKTVEGLIGGLLGSSFTGFAFGVAASHFNLAITPRASIVELTFLGFFCGLIAVFGDLAESLLKRDAKVKDSSSLPGFGGFLDIVDSNLFTTPLLYLYLCFKTLG